MRRAALAVLAMLALTTFLADGRTARGDDDPAALLAAPERAADVEALRRAAEDVLQASPKDPAALRALLIAVTKQGGGDLLDDAIARALPLAAPKGDALTAALGGALLRRARLEDPPDAKRLAEAARLLAYAEGAGGAAPAALDLAYARHLLTDVPGAKRAYERALDGDEKTGELAMRGLRNLWEGDAATWKQGIEPLLERHPTQPAIRAAYASNAAEVLGSFFGLRALDAIPWKGKETPRTLVLRARLLRGAGGRDAEALAVEREALERAGNDLDVEAGIERLWRADRPLGSFAACEELDRDYAVLRKRAAGDALRTLSYVNNLAFRFREVVSTFTWRGEGRTQGLAEGSPKAARVLLSRCVVLYDEAVAAIPVDAMGRPFAERWIYAGIANDAGIMRHYFVDTRDLDRAEALYQRAFELTDGAYMDTYFYNLQYLYGFEKPGNEETWFRYARRAAERILKETASGGFEPDERKREAARRDAASLKQILEAHR